jgi:hypothetical protein
MSKPDDSDVTQASMVLVLHAGQSGRKMIMTLRLGQGGSLTLSVTGRCRYRVGDGHSLEPLPFPALFNFAHFINNSQKIN